MGCGDGCSGVFVRPPVARTAMALCCRGPRNDGTGQKSGDDANIDKYEQRPLHDEIERPQADNDKVAVVDGENNQDERQRNGDEPV